MKYKILFLFVICLCFDVLIDESEFTYENEQQLNQLLLPKNQGRKNGATATLAHLVIDGMKDDQFKVGKTTIFFHAYVVVPHFGLCELARCRKPVVADCTTQQHSVRKLEKAKQMAAEWEEMDKDFEKSTIHSQEIQEHMEQLSTANTKLEGKGRIARESFEEMGKQRQDMVNSLKRKEADMFAFLMRFEHTQSQTAKLQREAQEMDIRCNELEAELEVERQARVLQYESDKLQERLDKHVAATSAQVKANKKIDAEVAKLRPKGSADLTELHEQNQVQRLKNRAKKKQSTYQRQLEMASKQCIEMKQRAKQLNGLELHLKTEEKSRKLQELYFSKGRLQFESSDFARQLEDLEAQIEVASRLKSQYFSQAEELKRAAAEEIREKQALNTHIKNLQHGLGQLVRETLDEEIANKSNLLRQLTREQAKAQQRSKFESDGLVPDEELDEIRRKQLAEIAELQNKLDSVNARFQSLVKQLARFGAEASGGRADADALSQQAHQMEKRQRAHEKQVDEWRHQAHDLQSELDAVQREARIQAMKAHRLVASQNSLPEQVEGSRRENRQLGQEIRDLQDQVMDSQRTLNDLEKLQRQLEAERAESQHALDGAEAAFETEEGKVMRTQIELSQIRDEIEKKLQVKEEEFENTRKSHQHVIEDMQAYLEQEALNKVELARVNKKLESDINELELALEHTNWTNDDVQKNIRRYCDQGKEHAKTGAVEAAKLAEELCVEQELLNVVERQKKIVEMQVKELQVEIEETEVADMKAEPELAVKLEGQLKTVESELENEQRRAHELQFEAEEERKNYGKLCDLADKLQNKIIEFFVIVANLLKTILAMMLIIRISGRHSNSILFLILIPQISTELLQCYESESMEIWEKLTPKFAPVDYACALELCVRNDKNERFYSSIVDQTSNSQFTAHIKVLCFNSGAKYKIVKCQKNLCNPNNGSTNGQIDQQPQKEENQNQVGSNGWPRDDLIGAQGAQQPGNVSPHAGDSEEIDFEFARTSNFIPRKFSDNGCCTMVYHKEIMPWTVLKLLMKFGGGNPKQENGYESVSFCSEKHCKELATEYENMRRKFNIK